MRILRRWESKGKKYWVELVQYTDDGTFGYRSDNSGGWSYPTLEMAQAAAERQCSYCPSKMGEVAIQSAQ